MTHTLQVLHSLQWHQPSKDERALTQALTVAYHSYTHTLLGVVEKRVSGPGGPPVKGQENTALLSDCCLTGTPLRASLSGLGGKECSVCVHSVYVEDVGVPSPLLAEVQFVDCVISARFSLGRKIQIRRRQLLLHQFTLTCPPEKQRRMNWVSDGGTKPASTCYTLLTLTYDTLFLNPVTSKQAEGTPPVLL